MAWEENSCISLNMQLIAILSRIGVSMMQNRHTRSSSATDLAYMSSVTRHRQLMVVILRIASSRMVG